MNNALHFEALVAADLALEQAKAHLKAVHAAAQEVSPIKMGQRIPAKTSSGGIECEMEVTAISAYPGQSQDGLKFLSVRLGGKKVNKNGSLANIECYAYLSIAL